MNRVVTLTEHIIQQEHKVPGATGSLTIVLNQIAEAGKNIASHVKRSGLADIIGKTGNTNAFDEEVQKLDEYSNDILIDMLRQTGHVATIASEELEKPLDVNKHGKYDVFFDPLDGSSNIDVNVSVGTIFSIYHHTNVLLKPGSQQVAAGYILYGSSVMLVYTCGDGVHGFTLDPAIGSFLLSHPSMTIPPTLAEYSINEGNAALYHAGTRAYLEAIKSGEKPYRLRYIGSLVADIHRILVRGGIFLYPADTKNTQGKLRLMHEINAVSLLLERAGGRAIGAEGQSPLEKSARSVHERTPFVGGSTAEVEKYLHISQNEQ